MIRFLHPCYVPSETEGEPATFYDAEAEVEESQIPAEWLKGALEHFFVERMEPVADKAI